jgi:hypothetical protein
LELNFLQFEGEEMKKLILASLLCLAAVMVITPAYATETWDPHLHGVDEGLAAGALPPPGVYFINDSYFAPAAPIQGSNGKETVGLQLFAYVDVPILLWVPGCKFLGADYGVAIAEPFDYVALRTPAYINGQHDNLVGEQWGTFNTIILPYILSWKLPCDFRVKTALAIGIADATTAKGDSSVDNAVTPFAPSGNGYWSFTPELGISWLHAGWNASAEFFYTFGLKNDSYQGGYQSGQQFAADYTLTYTCGKWTFGAGAGQEQQVFNDSNAAGTIGDSMARLWTAGPIVGYNFGPCSLMLTVNFPISGTNDPVGSFYNVRLVIPLWK